MALPSPTLSGSRDAGSEFLLQLMAHADCVATSAFTKTLRSHGLNLPIWRVLCNLADGTPKPVTVLAERCCFQQPTMTKMLDRMTRNGLVVREPDSRDRRVVLIKLTSAGTERAKKAVCLARDYEASTLGGCTENLDLLKGMLHAFIAANTKPARKATTPQSAGTPTAPAPADRSEDWRAKLLTVADYA